MGNLHEPINREILRVTIPALIDGWYEFMGKRFYLKAGQTKELIFREHDLKGKLLDLSKIFHITPVMDHTKE